MAISPVLEAFFGGQKQQADLISQAKDLSDAAARRAQAQQELQQRQQTIDEIAKQHDIENQHNQSQLELQNKIFQDTHQYHMNEATRNYIQQLRESNVAPDQFHQVLKNLSVPGYTAPATGGDLPVRGNPVNIPNVSVPQANPTQTVDIPGYGPQNVPAWKTNSQIAAENALATLPAKVDEYKQTVGATNIEKLNAQMERLQDTLASRESQHQAQMDLQKQLADIRVAQAENAANHRFAQFNLQAGLPMDAEDAKKLVNGYAMDELTGKGTGNPRVAYGPVVGNMVQKLITDSGGRVLPGKVRDSIMGKANDVTQTLNTLDQLRQSVPIPNTLTGKASNILADKFGMSGLSPYKSIFDSINTSLVPKMDIALGFTPGTLSRSPKLYDKIKSIAPLPGDSKDVIQQKTSNAADIFLSSISKDLAGYSTNQRKALWQEIANDHPELINGNKGIRQKLFEAGNTGTYTPGEGWKLFGGN